MTRLLKGVSVILRTSLQQSKIALCHHVSRSILTTTGQSILSLILIIVRRTTRVETRTETKAVGMFMEAVSGELDHGEQ